MGTKRPEVHVHEAVRPDWGEAWAQPVRPIHEAIWEKISLAASYRLIEIPRGELAAVVPELLRTLDGFNITVPYKTDVMPLLDEITPFAREVGAVNTVLTGKTSRGYNTDDPGFEQMLRHFGMNPDGRPVFILGSGGAMHACRNAVERMGARETWVVSRSPKHADEISYDDFYARFPDMGGLIVNTTPAGMYPRVEGCPIDAAHLTSIVARADGVADIIFNPAETVLTAAAKRVGTPACTGLYMLIAQAVEAESIWQGCSMPPHLAETLMKELHLL